MIFLTVGTQFAFDRLIKAVDEAVSLGATTERIFAQIGDSQYKPVNFDFAHVLDKHEFDDCIHSSNSLIGHAGMGTINSAIEAQKPLLVMPRLKKFGEVVNDHQFTIAKMFEKLGLILAAYDAAEVAAKLELLKTFTPAARVSQASEVANRIHDFIETVSKS